MGSDASRLLAISSKPRVCLVRSKRTRQARSLSPSWIAGAKFSGKGIYAAAQRRTGAISCRRIAADRPSDHKRLRAELNRSLNLKKKCELTALHRPNSNCRGDLRAVSHADLVRFSERFRSDRARARQSERLASKHCTPEVIAPGLFPVFEALHCARGAAAAVRRKLTAARFNVLCRLLEIAVHMTALRLCAHDALQLRSCVATSPIYPLREIEPMAASTSHDQRGGDPCGWPRMHERSNASAIVNKQERVAIVRKARWPLAAGAIGLSSATAFPNQFQATSPVEDPRVRPTHRARVLDQQPHARRVFRRRIRRDARELRRPHDQQSSRERVACGWRRERAALTTRSTRQQSRGAVLTVPAAVSGGLQHVRGRRLRSHAW